MLRTFVRLLLVAGVALLALMGALFGPGHSGAIATKPAFAQPSFGPGGISAASAARALNALSRQNAAHSSKSLTDVHFILNWVPNVEFAGLWMAEKQKVWEKNGLHLSYTPWSQSVTPEKDVPARGGDTFGFQSGAAIAIAVSQGEKITALYTDTQQSVFGLTVMNSSHITNLKQLKGKKVGYQSDELYVPQTMLSYVGLKQTDWTPVPVGFNIDQLTSGHVAAYLVFVTNEPISLAMNHQAATTFPAYKYGFKSYDDVMFTYNGLIKSNPSLVKKVTGIVARAFQYGHTHVQQTARYVTSTTYKLANSKQNLEQQILELQAFKPYSQTSPGHYAGTMNTGHWQQLINTLFKYGLIKSKPNAATIYTNRFNPY
jgi:ABC-type nitrate/sulfonate/bicarbonate transport system substrate-binding protein